MCVCNMKAIRLAVSEISSGNETRTHRRTDAQPNMLMTIPPPLLCRRGIKSLILMHVVGVLVICVYISKIRCAQYIVYYISLSAGRGP